jgi:hypothetical protein
MRQLKINRDNKKLSKLKSGKYGKVQGKKTIEGYEIKDKEGNVRKVAYNYESPEGVKAKDIEGATPVMSKYGAPKGKLGGAVGRKPMPERENVDKPKLSLLEEKTTGFKASKFDSSGKEIIGDVAEGKTKDEIKLKANPIAKSKGVSGVRTDLDTHDNTNELNEYIRDVNKLRTNRYNKDIKEYETAKESNKLKFGKGRTAEQKKANEEARDVARKTGEGKRKTMRQIYKKLKQN